MLPTIKKIILFLFVCFVLGILGGGGYFFYQGKSIDKKKEIDKKEFVEEKGEKVIGEDKKVEEEVSGFSPIKEDEAIRKTVEEEREICLARLEGVNDEKLVEEVEKELGLKKGVRARKEKIIEPFRYFNCRYEYSQSEGAYNTMINFWELAGATEEERQKMTLKSKKMIEQNLYFYLLSEADLLQITPKEFTEACKASVKKYGNFLSFTASGEKITIVEWCNNIHSYLSNFEFDSEKLENEINYKYWHDNPEIARGQYKNVARMVYRFSDVEVAMQVCENVVSSQKEECRIYVEEIQAQKEGKACKEMRADLKNLICKYEV